MPGTPNKKLIVVGAALDFLGVLLVAGGIFLLSRSPLSVGQREIMLICFMAGTPLLFAGPFLFIAAFRQKPKP